MEQISQLVAGRVSFLLDTDLEAYPKKEFVGTSIPGVPYLKITKCELSPFHARTLIHEQKRAKDVRESQAGSVGENDTVRGLAANAYSLNDLAYPNPEFPIPAAEQPYGLYNSNNTLSTIADAPAAWRQATGIIVDSNHETKSGGRFLTGPWLGADQLSQYSSKYSHMLTDLLAKLQVTNSGKIMIYHHRVHMSGVLLIAEILRMNGFADETSEPTNETLCSICGVPRGRHSDGGAHAEPHTYMPARFILAHSDIDRAAMLRSISRFNAPENLHGREFRVLIGSKVVREGLNFKAVRNLFVTSMPTDYPTLLQIFGRVVRKDSHRELPVKERDVQIKVYVGIMQALPTPELQRYIDKGQEYLVIQKVERALHIGAVDGFANYGRIRNALEGLDGDADGATGSLLALPYSPLLNANQAIQLSPQSITFDAYGHGKRLVTAATAVCRALFTARPVWTFPDLWAAVREGAVKNVGISPAAFTEGSVAAGLLALKKITQWGTGLGRVVRAGKYYIAIPNNSNIDEPIDVESWLRYPIFALRSKLYAGRSVASRVSIPIGAYIREARSGQNFAVHLREFEKTYMVPDGRTIDLSLVELSGAFHTELLRRLIIAANQHAANQHAANQHADLPNSSDLPRGTTVTSNDARVASMYIRFRIGITEEARAKLQRHTKNATTSATASSKKLVGYATPDSITLFEPKPPANQANQANQYTDLQYTNLQTLGRWYSAPLAEYGYGRRQRENSIVIGFVTPAREVGHGASIDDSMSGGARFKIRPSLHMQSEKASDKGAIANSAESLDIRTIERGAVCETRPREELDTYAKELRDALGKNSAAPAKENKCMAAKRFDKAATKRFPSAGELCDTIKLHLLELEERARAPADGMMNGLRWLYLFTDRAPSVAASLIKM